MKAVYKNSMVLAASLVIAGTAMAKDDHKAVRQGAATNSPTPFTLVLKPEPTLNAGANLQFTELFVDLIRPQQTWSLLNPAAPSQVVPKPPIQPALIQTVAPPLPNNDLKVHDANFAVLKISFP